MYIMFADEKIEKKTSFDYIWFDFFVLRGLLFVNFFCESIIILKVRFLMSNVIPITHSKLQIISIKGRSSSVSPLKDKDNSLNNRT